MHRTTLALLLVAAIAGCGGQRQATDEDNGRSFNSGNDARYTEDQVATKAGFAPDPDIPGLSWSYHGCEIAVIMTDRPTVELYASAGDDVVTNEAGDVGVKFHADPGCREKLLAALDRVN